MRKQLLIAVLLASALAITAFVQTTDATQNQAPAQTPAPAQARPAPTGYMDTPLIPGTKWHIHDDTRPRPAVITPAANPGEPPSDAIVLFSGKESDIAQWEDSKGQPTKWRVVEGAMECVPRSGYIRTKQKFGDVQLHIEFATPTPPSGNSQGRGNSGVFFSDGSFEVQVLDSYDNKSYADGQCGAMYGQYPPLVNASRKPGEWQYYDIVYHMPRFQDGKVVKPATASVFHNGVLLHEKREFLGPTTHKNIRPYVPIEKGSLQLQDHGNPVRYRNIWVRELEQYENSPTQLDKQ
ncbi:MAG: DUF1080 domain-containing protein [Acidobacteria bacterium]|nr:MAG: DUF1080 domain-containing protein [Acidobacteriota bacterium]